ncbi:flagellar hook-associated protein FlgL [Bacillus sp. E214]|uniref:flagellar hook-associated protein FlgL n=1 Tax=Bacillus sp. E214 TaxID=2587156 RepID=UPI0011E06CA6|nr:flagellar hook-associated protein FlgL [Bacillus sp. E214]
MRVTQSMVAANSLRNINKSYGSMAQYLEQLSTGKKITKASDDPVIAQKGMYYRTSLNEVEQYKRNLSELYLWMDNSEASMDQGNKSFQRIRELMIQAKNDTNETADREAIAKEIAQLKEDLVSVANTQVAGRYIFNGTSVNAAPVTSDANGVVVNSENDPYLVEVSRGIQLKANADPSQLFSQELFNTIGEIESELSADDMDLDSLLQKFDGLVTAFSAERSDLGARYNRLELLESRIDNQEVLAKKVLSENEDVDMEKVYTDFITQESVHRAALQMGASIIQPSLVDFLR